MIEITNEPYGRCGFYFNGVGCVIADAAGDFVITVRGGDECAKVGFSIIEAKRLIATLRSKGGSRFDEEQTPFGRKHGVPCNGWVSVKTKTSGDVEFSGQESFGGIFTEEGLQPSDAMYRPAKVVMKAADMPDLIDAMARLVDTRPASIDKTIDFSLCREEMDFKDEVLDLVARGRYLEASEIFYNKMTAYHKARTEEHERWVAGLDEEELAAYKARRAETARFILDALNAPLPLEKISE